MRWVGLELKWLVYIVGRVDPRVFDEGQREGFDENTQQGMGLGGQ